MAAHPNARIRSSLSALVGVGAIALLATVPSLVGAAGGEHQNKSEWIAQLDVRHHDEDASTSGDDTADDEAADDDGHRSGHDDTTTSVTVAG